MRRRQATFIVSALPLLSMFGGGVNGCSRGLAPVAWGSTFLAPPSDIDIVGRVRIVTAAAGESLVDIARRYRLGQEALRLANPELPTWLPLSAARVVLPLRHLLPATTRTGLVVNLPERRLYDYTLMQVATAGRARIAVYPVSIGRVDWATPLGESRIVARRADPDWTPPASIRAEAAARGRTLPARVPAGPGNPLGRHALYLDRAGYLLHGTNDTNAIGLRVTHGCIRLYPADIAALFRRVANGTPIHFVDQPLKVGWHAGLLHLEVHPPLAERTRSNTELVDDAFALVARALRERSGTRIESTRIRRAVERPSGQPVVVARADGALPR